MTDKPVKIRLKHVTKQYDLLKNKTEKITAALLNKKTDSFWALRDVNIEIRDGETVGLIGINGSGKSTISSIISGVIVPTSGEVEINGEASLIAIQVGLKGPLTGVENIRLKLLMHGLTNKEIEAQIPSIIEFADIGDFINQPIKNYSSGMKSRLGFAISVHLDPDILVIDEALSVGDETFYQKCVDKINEFKARGKTIIFVSHSITQVKNLCDRIVWMHYGQIRQDGDKETVAKAYIEFVKWYNSISKEEKKTYIEGHREEQKLGTGLSLERKKPTQKTISKMNVVIACLIAALTIFFGYLVASGTSFIGLFADETPQEQIVHEASAIQPVPFQDLE